jgi:uncharacterized protein (DUF169 family)
VAAIPDVQRLLGHHKPPVAVGFFDSPPTGVTARTGPPAASGCTYWREAQQGSVFYTVRSDHYNCAVGAYTHNIAMPAERAGELSQTLEFVDANNYVSIEEVPGIPVLATSPKVIAYGPVDRVPFTPDVVVVAALPAQAMLLYEAALKAGASGAVMNALGRPACAALPLAINTGAAALSLGCKGNRTYTGLPESEMYVSIPGGKWAEVAARVAEVVEANRAIGAYHEERKRQFQAV